MNHGLTAETVAKICGVFSRFPAIKKAVLYGSRAKGNYKTGSDIDLTLMGDELTASQLGDIADQLDDLLLPYTIDLSHFEALNHAKLKEHIERVGKVFYERGDAVEDQGVDMKAGWQTKTLAEVCQIKPPKAEARQRVSGKELVSFVPMEDLGIDQKVVVPTQAKPLEDVAGSYTYFADGDVLLAKITPCFENGKLGIADSLTNGIGFGSSEYIVFRPSPDVDKEWLYYFLSRQSFREEGAERMSGAVGHKRVSKEFIESYPIPVPPLPEQHRIVAILDEAFDGIATAKANAEQNLQNARAIFESHLQRVFTERGEGWAATTLGAEIDLLAGFAFKSAKYTNDDDDIRLLRGDNIIQGCLRWDDVKKWPANETEEFDRYLLEEGDVVLAMDRPWVKAGLKHATISADDLPCLLVQRTARLRGGPNLDNRFLKLLIGSAAFTSHILGVQTGIGVPHISGQQIKDFEFTRPPVADQRLVADTLESLRKETQRLASLYQQKLAALDALKKSLLHQAFSGQL